MNGMRNSPSLDGVKNIMLHLRLILLGVLLCLPSVATLIPWPPNLAKRIEDSDVIVVGTLLRGTTSASGDLISSDVVLKADRVLKGNLMAGDEVAAHLQGRATLLAPNATTSSIQQRIHGIWFLKGTSVPYVVVSGVDNAGELRWAVVNLPEPATPGAVGKTPADSVANELAAALRWLADVHGGELKALPASDGSGGRFFGLYASQFHDLAENLVTLQSVPMYREFAAAKSPHLRVVGIQGLIAANEPEGVKRTAADWDELAGMADVYEIINVLTAYSNDSDPDAIRALAALALRPNAEPALRTNASYVLRAIHTKGTLPALVALLDDKTKRVQSNALSGLCLFVRNAPLVTPQSVPSMSWMQSREPAPFLTPETKQHCVLGGLVSDRDVDSQVLFWKSWWNEHRTEIGDL